MSTSQTYVHSTSYQAKTCSTLSVTAPPCALQTCADWNHGTFSGTDLPNCQFLASAIQTCQSKGKIAVISLGGGGADPVFSSDSQASQFADTIWNLFLGGSSGTRPFGSAVLDG